MKGSARGYTYLIVQPICDIETLEDEDKPHAPRDIFPTATPYGLRTDHTNVDENPKDEPRAEFVERLDVERANRGVQFATDVELREPRVSGT